MKLTSEHIKKPIRSSNAPEIRGKLFGVSETGEIIWMKKSDGDYAMFGNYNWELIEEPKKPSDRIAEMHNELYPQAQPGSNMIYAICRYLDELREQGKI